MYYPFQVAKTKALIICAVTAQLICAAGGWFSGVAAHKLHTVFVWLLGNKNVTPVSPDIVAAIIAETERKMKMATPVESTASAQVSDCTCLFRKNNKITVTVNKVWAALMAERLRALFLNHSIISLLCLIQHIVSHFLITRSSHCCVWCGFGARSGHM